MRINYRDRDGKNEYNAECSVSVDVAQGQISVSVLSGDMDGPHYDIYVPNHRTAILKLISELQDVLDATNGWDQGYDGFNYDWIQTVATFPLGEGETAEDWDESERAGVVTEY